MIVQKPFPILPAFLSSVEWLLCSICPFTYFHRRHRSLLLQRIWCRKCFNWLKWIGIGKSSIRCAQQHIHACKERHASRSHRFRMKRQLKLRKYDHYKRIEIVTVCTDVRCVRNRQKHFDDSKQYLAANLDQCRTNERTLHFISFLAVAETLKNSIDWNYQEVIELSYQYQYQQSAAVVKTLTNCIAIAYERVCPSAHPGRKLLINWFVTNENEQ